MKSSRLQNGFNNRKMTPPTGHKRENVDQLYHTTLIKDLAYEVEAHLKDTVNGSI
jgi:hypothetical protein